MTHAAVVGIGVDAVDIDRFRRVLARRPNISNRLFTEAERSYANRSSDPVPRLAVRFAAKEAALKALGEGIGAAPFRDIEVIRSKGACRDLLFMETLRAWPVKKESSAGTFRSRTPGMSGR